MNIWKISLMAIAMHLSGIALAYSSQLDTTAKTGLAFRELKKIAVIKFKNPGDEPSGQVAADILAMDFAKQGFNVVGGSLIASLIDQNEIYRTGLTPEIKSRLKSSGIDAIVLGSINEYFCSLPGGGPWLGRADTNNRCTVSVTANMLNLDSGEIVWGVSNGDHQEGKWTTAESVLRSVMQSMQTAIPNLFTPTTAIAGPSGTIQPLCPCPETKPGAPAPVKQ
jgi:curli biogenesis system outer membrane secretion channel CsgG